MRLSFVRDRRLLLLLLVGCHPQRGASGSDFSRVVTPHFTVYSDVSLRSAETHARTLETMLQGLLENGWEHHGKLPLKLNVILLKDPVEFERYAGVEYAGYFRDNLLFEPWAVLPAPRGAIELQVLIHELSHHLANLALQNQPFWFSEGLAGYYETASFDPDGRFVLGNPDREHYRALSQLGPLPSAQLFAFDVQHTPRAYATAWLLVHYLMSKRGEDFVRYQGELGQGKSQVLAWAAAFPDLSEAALDEALQDYYTAGAYEVLHAPLTAAEVPIQSAALSRAGEEAVRALLWQTCVRCSPEKRVAQVREHLQRALALDPKQIEARLLSLDLLATDDERRALLARITKDAPEDYRAWLGLALLDEGEPARAAIERVLVLAPQQPSAWLALARYQWNTGSRDAALASVQRGLRLRPTMLELLGLYAELLFHVGRCSELADVVTRARSVERASPTPEQQVRLSEMSQTCKQGVATP